MSAYTRKKAKSKYRDRIRLERASQKQSSDTSKTPYDRVKRYRERQKMKASEPNNAGASTSAAGAAEPIQVDDKTEQKYRCTSMTVLVNEMNTESGVQVYEYDNKDIKEESEDDPHYGYRYEITEIDEKLEEKYAPQLSPHQFKSTDDGENVLLKEVNKPLPVSKGKDSTWADFPWKCVTCLEVHESINQLIEHNKTVHKIGVVNLGWFCSDCQNTYPQYNTLINHVRRIHRKHLALICDICNSNCSSFEDLKDHRQVVHANDDIPLILLCGLCGLACKNSNSFLVHNKGHVTKEKDYKHTCNLCNKKFRGHANLTSHLLTHAGTRDYACEQCGKKFIRRGNLEQHLITHITANSYECSLCNKFFKTPGHLVVHNRIHKSKPFCCEECGKRFHRKYALDLHIKIHTGEKPYSCEFCQQSFRLKTTYMTHYYEHTGNKPFTCVICNRDFSNRSNFNQHMRVRHGTSPTALNSEPTVKLKEETVEENGTLDA